MRTGGSRSSLMWSDHHVMCSAHHVLWSDHDVPWSDHHVLWSDHDVPWSDHHVLWSDHHVLWSDHHVLWSDHHVPWSDHHVLWSDHHVPWSDHHVLWCRSEPHSSSEPTNLAIATGVQLPLNGPPGLTADAVSSTSLSPNTGMLPSQSQKPCANRISHAAIVKNPCIAVGRVPGSGHCRPNRTSAVG